MKKFYIPTLVTLFALTTSQASANDLMNYGELSLSYSVSGYTQFTPNISADTSTPDNETINYGSSSTRVNVDNNDLHLNLAADFGNHFFGGVTIREARFEAKIDNYQPLDFANDALKDKNTITELFVGGAYHIDQNTHLFGVATYSASDFDEFRASNIIYRIGAKKAWGNFVGTVEKNVNVIHDLTPLTVSGKYYFSRNAFAGARVELNGTSTSTGFTVGYTF